MAVLALDAHMWALFAHVLFQLPECHHLLLDWIAEARNLHAFAVLEVVTKLSRRKDAALVFLRAVVPHLELVYELREYPIADILENVDAFLLAVGALL